MYTISDGADSWTDISAGLPSDDGFPMVVHPSDPETAFVIPLSGDSTGRHFPGGRAVVQRTQDGGKSWQALGEGLPQEQVYTNVLRQSMSMDSLDPTGVYFATATGHLFASNSNGETWQQLSEYLPPIYSVRAVVRDWSVATVRLPELLARLFPGAQRRYELGEATLLGVIDALERLHPGMRDRVCDGRPEIIRHINISVYGEKAGFGTRLTRDSEVDIIPAASGG